MSQRLAILTVCVAAACGGGDVTPVTQLNLDRPVDMAFACIGGLRITDGAPATVDQEIVVSGMPSEACDVRSEAHDTGFPEHVPPGQEDLTAQGGSPVGASAWYGFILQSVSGTVALAEFPTKPASAFGGGDVLVLDADPLTPGKNAISVGENPIAISVDKSGCYAITANAGSCDLSVLDVASAVDLDPKVRVDRFDVTNASDQPVRAMPAAMVIDNAGGLIGQKCAAAPTGIAYVAYPSCHLVAAVDTSVNKIVGGVQFDAAGVATLLPDGNVTCPEECGGPGMITAGTRPVTVDLQVQPGAGGSHRLAIGADNSSTVTIVELDPATSLPLSVLPIALDTTSLPAGTSLGVTNVALSPEIGMGGAGGVIDDDNSPGGKFQFVYAISTDNTIRVADILSLDKECDTQVDPRLLQNERNVTRASCYPVGDPTTPARRPGARGPGIALTSDAVPTSIEIFRSPESTTNNNLQGPDRLIGYFGVITAANGASFVLNVDDDDYPDFESDTDPLNVEITAAIAHQLRDSVGFRNVKSQIELTGGVLEHICNTNGPDPDSQAGVSGGPRATAPPSRVISSASIANEKVASLPSIRQVKCESTQDGDSPVSELGFAADDNTRDLEFPDLLALRSDEVWSLSWEGQLSLDKASSDVDGPSIRHSQIVVDSNGMRIVDETHPFCDAGVEPYDIVQLRGCDPAFGDTDCPIGYSCYVHPNSQIVGLGSCMLKDEADRLANACKDFLTTQRRYTVGRSDSGALKLLPRKHVLRTTPLDGCVDDQQCKALADYDATLLSSANPIVAATDSHTYACMVDNDRAPLDGAGQTGKRCVQTCSDTQACSVGSACQAGICMESVVPPQACVNAPQRYDLRAGEAFTVVGTKSGYVHPIVADSGGKCVADPAAHPFLRGRIPLQAPACDPTADPRTGRLPGGSFEPDPCSTTVDQTENAPNYVAAGCVLGAPTSQMITRQAPAIRFRNRGMTLTLVDPYYAGDQTCIGDRAGGLTKVPTVYPGYSLAWRLAAGFSPQILPIVPAFPIKVLHGPTDSIWVIDEGDFLSTSISQSSTRGKVYRIEPRSLLVNVLE